MSAAPPRLPVSSRNKSATTLVAGIVGALAMALSAFSPPAARAQAQPAHYQIRADLAASDAALALAGRLDASATVQELMAGDEGVALARAEVATLPGGRHLLLGWQSVAPEPILRRDVRADEELALVEALAKHLPSGSRILAFPGESRRLAALVAAELPLAAEPEPLAMTGPWVKQGDAVTAAEAAFWGESAAVGVDGPLLGSFVDALLAEDRNGAARLRVLAGVGTTFVLLHLDDAFQLGLWRPGRMQMTRRDFGASGFSHDFAAETRRLAQDLGQAAWAVGRAPDGALRAFFLSDAAETATLIAQLLPFNTSRLDTVPGLRLVWSHGGYWLYRLSDIEPATD